MGLFCTCPHGVILFLSLSWIGLIVGTGVRASLYCCELCINSQGQFLSTFMHYEKSSNTVQHGVCIFLHQNANSIFVLCTDCLWHLGCDIHPYSGCVGQLKLPGDVSLHLFWTVTGIVMLSIFGNEMFHTPCPAPALHNLSQWRVTPSEKPGEHNVPSSELRQIGMLLSSQDLIWCCSCCPLVLLWSGEIWWSRLCCLMTHGRVKQGEHAWRLQQALAETLVFLRMLNRWNTIVLFLTSEISHSSYSFLILFPHSWTKCCMEIKPCYLLGWQASLGWVHSQ